MVTDQVRTTFASTTPGRWEGIAPSPVKTGRQGGDRSAAEAATAQLGVSHARSGSWTEAARVRHLDQKLGRVEGDAETLRFNLEQVKLYPPYPVNESRRAEAIRQFNGVASEVARLEALQSSGVLQPLAPNASTEQAEQAVAELGALVSTIGAARAALAADAASPADPIAVATSRAAGGELAQIDAGLSASGAGFLRRFP